MGAVIRGASFHGTTSRGFTRDQLYSTLSYVTKDLRGIGLGGNDLTGWNFREQDLSNARFAYYAGGGLGNPPTPSILADADLRGARLVEATMSRSTLTNADLTSADLKNAGLCSSVLSGADLTSADVRGACFDDTTSRGFIKEQLYTTASYQAHDLEGIRLSRNDLSDWDLHAQNLSGASFYDTDLTNANLSGANLSNSVIDNSILLTNANLNLSFADTRGAIVAVPDNADTQNMIWPDGTIHGLGLSAGQKLVIRDDDGVLDPAPQFWLTPREPIRVTIRDKITIAESGVLQLWFQSDPWDSVISFERGIPVQLGGTLELVFAEDVGVAHQTGRTFKLFDWTGVSPTGRFQVDSWYIWDLTNLYTTGEVTLTAVPEPSSTAMLIVYTAMMSSCCRRGVNNSRSFTNR